MNYENIEFDISNGVAELILNRPSALNSLTAAMHSEIAAAIAETHKSGSARALLLTGAGRGFCAGQDLNDRAVKADTEQIDLGHTIDAYYNPLVRSLKQLPMPVVCAVNGVAAGAGANIALACDIVIAARSAKFIQSFCKLGLVPDSGGTWVLPRLVGSARANAIALLGESMSADEALAIGMIYAVVDDNSLQTRARELCEHFATQPTLGLAAIKKALQQSWQNDLDTQLDLERDLQRELGRSTDYSEGVSAFLEKRAPRFVGK